MRFPTSVRPFVLAVMAGLFGPQLAPAFTLIEKQLPLTVSVDPAQTFRYSYVAWGGYTDSARTNFIIAIEPLNFLPAVQRTDINVVLAVPVTSFDPEASILMCDGSVRVAMGLNGPGASMALGPPAQSFSQFFGGPAGGPSEQTLINAFVTGNQTELGNFFKQNINYIGSPLTTNAQIVGFSTAVADGSEQVIERPPGDTNFDGAVNFDDLLNLAQHYGSMNGTYGTGDLNGDAKVDFTDLLLLAQNYGRRITPAPFPAVAQPVPEPTAAISVSTAMLLFLRPRSFGHTRRRVTTAALC